MSTTPDVMPAPHLNTIRESYPMLDLVRGIAAIAVVAGHLRALILVDYGTLVEPSPLIKLFYFLTGLGHSAVMVFFVLSGFFISRSVLGDIERGNWSLRRYFVARISRLWLVLIPALIATLFFDLLGIYWLESPLYYGESGLNVLPTKPIAHLISAEIFLGNLLFVETILVPAFGSNGPLWSLACEFWYYVLFALICTGLLGRESRFIRVSTLSVAGAILFWLPVNISLSFGIWLLGWVALLVVRIKAVGNLGNPAKLFATLLFFAVIALARFNKFGAFSDLAIAVASVPLVVCFSQVAVQTERLRHSMTALGLFSYSLYVFHFPFALLALALLGADTGRIAPDASGLAFYVSLLILTCAFGALMYRAFEAHTDRIRRALLRLFGL